MEIKAVIFDMDGLLIDSEPLWHEAEIKSFAKVNIKLNKKLCQETTGLRVDMVVDYWYKKYPWKNISKKDLEKLIMQEVINLVETQGVGKDGVKEILDFLKNKNVKIALASSSNMDLIGAVIKKLNIAHYFDAIHSAEFEEFSKPHPSIYINTAKSIGVLPQDCLAFEDSFNGLLSAKSARMKCVCIPDLISRNDKKLSIADVILPSLLNFDDKIWKEMNK